MEPRLPNLIVIGAAKCGTSSLHHYLGLHPDITMSRQKELNFSTTEQTRARGLDRIERGSDSSTGALTASCASCRIRGRGAPVTESPGSGSSGATSQPSCPPRRGLRFDDYRSAIRNLEAMEAFPADVILDLERLPGFRNVLIHAYVDLDLNLAVQAMDRLAPIEQFVSIVSRLSKEELKEERTAMTYDLDEIMERLERHRQAATYGAVAGLVAGIARGLMQGRPRSHRGSWIVAADDHQLTGYVENELHPELLHSIQTKGVISDSEQLQVWLVTHP